MNGLEADGIVGKATWTKLSAVEEALGRLNTMLHKELEKLVLVTPTLALELTTF